jgi:hypothetical protein
MATSSIVFVPGMFFQPVWASLQPSDPTFTNKRLLPRPLDTHAPCWARVRLFLFPVILSLIHHNGRTSVHGFCPWMCFFQPVWKQAFKPSDPTFTNKRLPETLLRRMMRHVRLFFISLWFCAWISSWMATSVHGFVMECVFQPVWASSTIRSHFLQINALLPRPLLHALSPAGTYDFSYFPVILSLISWWMALFSSLSLNVFFSKFYKAFNHRSHFLWIKRLLPRPFFWHA